MLHFFLSFIYLSISVYYLARQNLSFEQRLHASLASFLMIYSLLRQKFHITDLPIFFTIHICLYIIDGGLQQPLWMSIYICYLIVFKIIERAENKIYQMSFELYRVLPCWEYEFIYTNEADPRISLTTAEKREYNDIIHEYVKTRKKEEVPVLMSPKEREIWFISDNKSIFINRIYRCLISTGLCCAIISTYALWWLRISNDFRYYFIFDVIMFISLCCSSKIQMVVYHTVFISATIYLNYPEFNPSIYQSNKTIS